MYTNIVEYENIHGNPLLLSCKGIGSSANGCEIIVMFKSNQSHKWIIFGLAPLVCQIFFLLNQISSLYLAIVFLIILIFIYHEAYKVISEHVSLIPYIGLQYSVKYRRGSTKDTFIQWEKIDTFIINEVIERQRIIYLITVIIKNSCGESSLVCLFRATKPRLNCLEQIYKNLQTVLDGCNSMRS